LLKKNKQITKKNPLFLQNQQILAARGRCDFFSWSLQAITKTMQTKEKNQACIFKGKVNSLQGVRKIR